MTLSRFWMYHLMAVAAVTVVFSAYKRKKYQDIYEASAILELKKELEEMYPHHYTKPTLVHTVVTGTCTAIANQAVQTAYSFDERISDTPPRLFLFYYLHVWILLARDPQWIILDNLSTALDYLTGLLMRLNSDFYFSPCIPDESCRYIFRFQTKKSHYFQTLDARIIHLFRVPL